jgi:N-acetylglutamate synthase
MQPTREQRVRMERAHVHAWPALRTASVDGWLWRASGGGSQRANSVSTVGFTGDDPVAAIAMVEAKYAAEGSVARFQTFDESQPPGLPELLEARGYRPGEDTVTMFKRPGFTPEPPGVERRDSAWPEWVATYSGEITPNRRAVNAEILRAVPHPRIFFGCRRNDRIAATALCVVGFGCAVVECVATRGDARRQGAAIAVMTALEAWATNQAVDLIGLQVVSTNAPAIRLYERLGFAPGATNRFWVRDTEPARDP